MTEPTKALTFRDLNIGDTFDINASDTPRPHFFARCTKISAKRCEWMDGGKRKTGEMDAHEAVYHVEQAATQESKPDTGTTPAAYKLKFEAKSLNGWREGGNYQQVLLELPDTGGKSSQPIYITAQAYGTKPKTFALTVTQNGFVKVERVD